MSGKQTPLVATSAALGLLVALALGVVRLFSTDGAATEHKWPRTFQPTKASRLQ